MDDISSKSVLENYSPTPFIRLVDHFCYFLDESIKKAPNPPLSQWLQIRKFGDPCLFRTPLLFSTWEWKLVSRGPRQIVKVKIRGSTNLFRKSFHYLPIYNLLGTHTRVCLLLCHIYDCNFRYLLCRMGELKEKCSSLFILPILLKLIVSLGVCYTVLVVSV